MLIDTHSHLFVEEFTEDLPLVMERAQKAGVSYICLLYTSDAADE